MELASDATPWAVLQLTVWGTEQRAAAWRNAPLIAHQHYRQSDNCQLAFKLQPKNVPQLVS